MKSRKAFNGAAVCIALLPLALPLEAIAAKRDMPNSMVGDFEASEGREFMEICKRLNMPGVLEYNDVDRMEISWDAPHFITKGKRAHELLDAIVDRYPTFEWDFKNGVLVMRPKHAPKDREDILARKIDLSITDSTGLVAAKAVLRAGRISTEHYEFMGALFKKVSINFQQVTVREALQAIARLEGQAAWRISVRNDPDGAVVLSYYSWRKIGVSSGKPYR